MRSTRSVSLVQVARPERPLTPESPSDSPASIESRAQFALFGQHSYSTQRPHQLPKTPVTPASSISSPFDSSSFDACQLPPIDADDWFDDFRSDISVSDYCPDRAELAAVQSCVLYDADGEKHTFGSLFDPSTAMHQRQFIIFVRHFYCGACQAYLQALTASITAEDYFRIPVPTSIIVIGCGQPHLIPKYRKFAGNCPWPMYADPTRTIYKKLGMNISFKIGRERPEYMKDISFNEWNKGQFKTVTKSLKEVDGIKKRDVLKGGNGLQVGGEFLFEDGEVVWCHRMRNMRNHTEVSYVRSLLEIDD